RRVLTELLGRVIGGGPEANRLVAFAFGGELGAARVGGVLLGLRELPSGPRGDRRALQVKRRRVGEGGRLRADGLVQLAFRLQSGERRRVLPPGLLKQLGRAPLRGGQRDVPARVFGGGAAGRLRAPGIGGAVRAVAVLAAGGGRAEPGAARVTC